MMKNQKIVTLVSLLSLPLMGMAQEAYLNEDFSQGLPPTFIQIDNDQNTPSGDMASLGFEVGKGWIAIIPSSENGNRVTCSTSWYNPSGTSDDWLITPTFEVKASDAVLRWRAKASDKRHRDGYAIYVSEGGSDIADFDKTQPLFTVAEEENAWTSHSVSLAAYAGKTIRVAFVNNSTDENCLYLDDVFAGQTSKIYFSMTFPDIIDRAGKMAVAGEAYTESDETINGFDATFTYNGETLSQHFDSVLTAGKRVAFQFNDSIQLDDNSQLPWTGSVKSGSDSYSQDGVLTVLGHRNLAEESTGTWCGWCVRGIVALETLTRDFSESMICVAVHSGHTASDTSEPMMDPDYYTAIEALNSGGFPKMMFNRNPEYTHIDPLYAVGVASALQKAEHPYSGIDVKAELGSDGKVYAVANTYFPVDADTINYKLSFVMIENNVHNANDDRYSQNNAYSGGGSGAMGGYEDKPSPVPASEMYYNEVARGYFGDFNGIEGSVPQTVEAMQPNPFSYSFDVPDSVMNIDNTEVIALLIDKNNCVVNAAKCKVENPSGISSVSADEQGGNVKRVTLTTVDGKVLGSWNGACPSLSMALKGYKGIVLIQTTTDKGTKVKKLLIR